MKLLGSVLQLNIGYCRPWPTQLNNKPACTYGFKWTFSLDCHILSPEQEHQQPTSLLGWMPQQDGDHNMVSIFTLKHQVPESEHQASMMQTKSPPLLILSESCTLSAQNMVSVLSAIPWCRMLWWRQISVKLFGVPFCPFHSLATRLFFPDNEKTVVGCGQRSSQSLLLIIQNLLFLFKYW